MKKKKNVKPQSVSLKSYIIANARKLPILKCYQISNPLDRTVQISVLREQKSGKLVVGFYLVDNLCLGLKDTFYRSFEDFTEFETIFLQNYFADKDIDTEEIEPNYAFNLIYGAIEFAEDCGFSPAKEFRVTEYILDDIDEVEYEEMEFGRNGKPVFDPSPFDNAKKIRQTLIDNVGEDGFYDLWS